MYPTPIAAALSGATERQLSYWRRARGETDALLVPEYGDERAWFYSFRDVMALRVFVATREKVSLQKLRKAVQQMDVPAHHPSEYRLLGYGDEVAVVGPGTDDSYVDTTGNLVFEAVVDTLFREFRYKGRRVRDLFEPYPEVSVNPEVRHGYPCIRGTRVPFHLVAGLVDDGVSPEAVRDFYPAVTAEAALDAHRFSQYVEAARVGRPVAA